MKTIKELKRLIPAMAVGVKKYVAPTALMAAVLNNQGESVALGEENDIFEFLAFVLQRIQDFLEWRKKQTDSA